MKDDSSHLVGAVPIPAAAPPTFTPASDQDDEADEYQRNEIAEHASRQIPGCY